MLGQRRAFAFALILFCGPSATRGDEFDRLSGDVLGQLLNDPAVQVQQALSFRELESLPTVLHDNRSALILVRTDLGNRAKLLVSPGFRKVPGKNTALLPVLLVERFEVFDASKRGSRLAHGREISLFSGFRLDLDSGSIVPDGLGGDLLFTARAEGDGSLTPLGGAVLATLSVPPRLPEAPPGRPSAGRSVRPADFSGKFRLVANGQWSGLLELAVDTSGTVSGTFSSDASGSAYPVTGQVDADMPQKIRFTIAFPRTRQDYQGVLWIDGKNVIAGILTMLGRDFGFVAVRDGTKLEVEGDGGLAELQPPDRLATWLRVRVEKAPDRYRVNKQADAKSASELTEFLAGALRAQPKLKVLVAAGESTPHVRVLEAIQAVQAAGITAIRLAPAAEDP